MGTGSVRAKSPVIPYCDERHRLLNEFTEAVQDLGLLQDQQVTALISGDMDFSRFDKLIHVANERKQSAKYAYISHIEMHGCASPKELPIP
jgi:hypothetical protein